MDDYDIVVKTTVATVDDWLGNETNLDETNLEAEINKAVEEAHNQAKLLNRPVRVIIEVKP